MSKKKTGKFAEGTKVPVMRSRSELEEMIRKHGGKDAVAAEVKGRAVLVWEADGRRFAIAKTLPVLTDFEVIERENTPAWAWKKRTPEQQCKMWEQACREDWRLLVLVVKARLVSVGSGLETWESAFLRWVVLPDGRALGDVLAPQVAESYDTGKMPPLLLPSGEGGQ